MTLNPNLVTLMWSKTCAMKWIAFAVCLLLSLLVSDVCWPQTTCGLQDGRLEVYKERILPFEKQIRTTLRNSNVDEQFIWLAIIESGGESNANSEKGASGLWQMTAATSKHYGCPPSERHNVECSTEAAAKYLSKLLSDFDGNVWDVIVAYNMGGANYKRSGEPTKEARNLANTVTCLMRETPYRYKEDFNEGGKFHKTHK